MCKECCKGKHPPEFDRQTATFVGRVGANLPVGIPADMMQWVIDHGPIAASLNLGYADLGQLEPLLTDRIGLGPREFHGLEVPDNFVAQVL
ncbi:MAG: hypothetical protein NT094_02475, partial [Candidatus Staskawiczbacteria bacterium]|nr:hypothetical protein [Candidatus Staskawiczbacteria bacterium]